MGLWYKNLVMKPPIRKKPPLANIPPTGTLPFWWLGFGVLARIIPHLPNFTPTTALCLFSGIHLNKKSSFLFFLSMMLISDLLLSYLHGHSMLGWWSLFTYSGFFIILIGGRYTRSFSVLGRAGTVLTASLFFWIWTNFGVWLTSALYPPTFSGFIATYTAAIPFLHYALLGDVVWSSVIFFSYYWAQHRWTLPQQSSS